MSLKVNISGIRGRYSDLSPNMVANAAQAFSTYTGKKKILIGCDNRPSSTFIMPAIISGLLACGSDVINMGTMPTPILQFLIKEYDFTGGVSVSAGHNMFDWNSIIFLNEDGAYLNYLEGEELFNIYHSGKFSEQNFNDLGIYSEDSRLIKKYFDRIETKLTSKNKMKFIIDCSNGFNKDIVEHLSKALNIELIPIFCGKSSNANKNPEPNIKNAEILSTVVRESKSDGGFLLNSDASRVLIVDERGIVLSEELTLPIFARIILEQEHSDIITNYSTSRMIDRVTKNYGVKVYKTDVGQSYVMQMVRDFKVLIGGEGNGSVSYSPISFGFDSFIFIKYFTEFLRDSNRKISSFIEEFPNPNIIKNTFYLKSYDIFNKLEELGKLYPDKEIIKDGFYFEDGDNWICIRSSATLSMIRVIGEGTYIKNDMDKINELIR